MKKLRYGEFGIIIEDKEIIIKIKKDKLEDLCMIKNLKKIGLVVFTNIIFCTNYCFANVSDSILATGTEKLIKDLTNWLLILAPILTILLVGYYFLRKSASDEMDGKRWDSRIKIAILCCVGVILASGLINLIIGYYR